MNIKKIIAILIAVIILVLNVAIIKNNTNNFSFDSLFSLTQGSLIQNVISDGDASSKIAVISISGVIEDGDYHDYIMNSFENIRNDDNIAGVIMQVNSPGGGVYESAEISDKIKQIKTEKDIMFYTVMGSVAASGGYYVSALSDKIYAMPETMTGSIGVIMSTLNYSGLLEKYGVSSEVIKSGEFKDIGSSTKIMSESDRAILQTMVDSSYNRFVNLVAEGRNMSVEEVKSIADGRIYDGAQAKELNLVDEFGYYEDALRDIKQALAIDNPQVISYEYKESFNGLLSLFTKSYINMNKSELQRNLDALKNIQTNTNNKPMYLYGGM